MSVQKEVIISGVGGQGMILCGTLIAETAVMHDHKQATLSSEYGSETRGTFAKSDVIVSDEAIYFPHATEPDIVVCLHQIAYNRYSGKTNEHTLLLYDSDCITENFEHANREKGVAISKLAIEAGNPATANIITMGTILGVLHLASPEGAKEVIRKFFRGKSEKIAAMNERAFDIGYSLGERLR